MGKSKSSHFFLKPTRTSSDLRFIASPRAVEECFFLVDGVATFKAMEETILDAKESVFMSFWIFNPNTKLLSKRSQKLHLKNWAQLIRYKAQQKVNVRIYLNDFDPILMHSLHIYAWKAFETLRKVQHKLNGGDQKYLEFMTIRHEAEGTIPIFFPQLKSRLVDKLTQIVEHLNKGSKSESKLRFNRSPGLWPLVEFSPKTNKYKLKAEPKHYYPASHHQKFCVTDQNTAIVGGLDVNFGRIDSPRHQSHKTAWHDVDILAKGDVARDVARNFIGIWNHNLSRFHTFIQEANKKASGRPISYSEVHPLTFERDLSPKKVKPKGLIQCLRTLSTEGWFGPSSTLRKDLLESYKKAIAQAEKYIYIENQYLRYSELANWIIARCEEVKDLVVICVLPVAPEEVSVKGGADLLTRHGLSLQYEILTKLESKLSSRRFGVYSMVKKKKAPKHPTNSFGSHQIYVHSKVLIVDDHFASIGSGNTNGRSFLVDSELALALYSPSLVRKFRLKLWKELLGESSISGWSSHEFITKWNKIALRNRNISTRKGFIVPHDKDQFKGKSLSSLLNKYAEVFDLESQDTTLA